MFANDAVVERYVPQSLADLKAAAQGSLDWIWHGYLAGKNLTLLTSLWKAGKSTLISVLLARLKTGGTLAGLPVRAGRAVVVSEEPPEQWVERGRHVDLDGHVDWLCLPFAGTPTETAWLELVARLERLHEERPVALLVIDSLANLSPMRSENDSVQMLRPLKPLRRLTERGVSVLIVHHPKKGATLPGQAARGSGALGGFVDIIVEMEALSRRPGDRRRLLRSFSRHGATPPSLAIEWTADGADYRSLGTSAELDFEHGWPVLHTILDQSETMLRRREILRRWPESALAPSQVMLWRWLGRAVLEGRLLQNGAGTKRDPFRYYLPGMVDRWQEMLWKRFGLGDDRREVNGKNPAALQESGLAAEPHSEEATVPGEAAPVSDGNVRTTATVSDAPEPEPSEEPDRPAEPTAGAGVRLPYPYNTMNPADVPEDVWRRAQCP